MNTLPHSKPEVGEPWVIPLGTEVYSVRTRQTTRQTRRQTIRPYFVDHYTDGRVIVTWAGSGGYWRRITLEEQADA